VEYTDSLCHPGTAVYRSAIVIGVVEYLMPSIQRQALMPYSAKQMYDIVNEVDRYPEFLPWCADSRILSQDEGSMEASILMRKGKLNHSFTTCNRLQDGKRIEVQLVKGPFKTLTGAWLFNDLPSHGSKIELDLKFEFSSRIISMLIGPIFTQIANSLVDAFCQRAHELYRGS
jgi:ribosome-associated toxin RatA of RatAB toxin-antitoxin module